MAKRRPILCHVRRVNRMLTSLRTIKPDPDAVARRERKLQQLKEQYGTKLRCHTKYNPEQKQERKNEPV